MPESSALIAELKRIATFGAPIQADPRPVDAWICEGLAKAQLHEIFAVEADAAPSGAGFAIACALAARAMPLLWLRTEASERQGGRLHARGLVELGLAPSALVLVVVADEASLLRAAADAARCTGLGTVLIESWGRAPAIDLTATRRLMLAAEASGVTVLSLRIAAEPVPSAAATRWRIEPAPSRTLDAGAPGAPAFQIELLRRRGGPAGLVWRMEWNRDTHSFEPIPDPDSATLSGARLPWLAVERLRTMRPHLFVGRAERPIAFVDQVAGGIRLKTLDREALRAGLVTGLTLADARARVPELDVYDHDAHADHDWLERLADGCQRYTPSVALDPPDGLILDIAGCVHEFEGERRLAADLEKRLARRGLLVRHAFGDTPDTARALARFAGAPAPDERRAVKRLPVAALGLDEDATTALSRAGLKTVGDVMARPLSGIAARFGAEAATMVRRLSGEVKGPIVARRTVARIAVERRFADPIARTDYALEVLADLATEAADRLAERHEGGRRWEARLFRTDGLVQALRIETGTPTRDVALLMRLFRERIDSLADPLDPGFGYDLVALDVALAERLDAAQLKLEGGAAQRGEVAQLVDQLGTRLGRARIRRFVGRDSHIPEQAELMLPAAEAPATAPTPWPMPEPGEPPLRPIYLFDPPQRIESMMAEVPDGPPHRFRWRRTIHEVAHAEGPERIAGEWWRRNDIPTRDYFRVEDRKGRRFWIFRHGLYSEIATPNWYLHGLFA